MSVFCYGKKEMEALKQKDKRLGEAIDRIGMIQRETMDDPFTALIYSIVGQQVSGKAAETVWRRLCQLCGDITAENLYAMDSSCIQRCGLSQRKADYIKGIAAAAMEDRTHFQALHTMSDQEIVHQLTKLRGVGAWTVEMLLIFSLRRPDIVSYHDFGIRKGMMKLYNLKALSKENFMRYRKRYSPYGTTASLYLWEIAAERDNS